MASMTAGPYQAHSGRHGRSMDPETRVTPQEKTTSREDLLARIEAGTAKHARTTTVEEVDRWIRQTRSRSI